MLILALIAAGALSAELINYFNGFASLENTYGEYDKWPASAKVELVKLMMENAVISSEDTTLWTNALSAQKQEAVSEVILSDYFSEIEYVDTYNVMINELGQFDEWPQEYKVLYSSALIQYRQQKDDWPIYVFPESCDIQQEEAISISRRTLNEKFNLNGDLDSAIVYATFLISPTEYGTDPVWIIEFKNQTLFHSRYRVILNKDGSVISYSAPNGQPYFEDTTDSSFSLNEAIPNSYDASEDYIVNIAQKKYFDMLGNSTADNIGIEAHFIYDERYNSGFEPVWIVYFKTDTNETLYKMLFTYDGEYMDGVPYKFEFQNTYNYYDVTDERFDYNFKDYSVEERANFSIKWKRVVDEYAKMRPYYKNYNTLWYQSTRSIYGIPSSDDVGQDEAKLIAQNYIASIGAQRSTVENREISFAFDVTDEEKPVWKVMLFGVNGSHQTQTDRMTYQVIINARTGEVINSYNNFEDDLSAYNF